MPRVIITLLVVLLSPPRPGTGKLKIFILAGQSNMQGHADVRTLQGMAGDPVTKPLYDKLVDENGRPREHEKVYIAAFSQQGAWGAPRVDKEKYGLLTVGYGGSTTDPSKLGPELAFGVTLQEALNEPILIIKTAWGGKSLAVDFRPPSAGPYEFPPEVAEQLKANNRFETALAGKNEKVGHYYQLMLKHVRSVLADPARVCPAYDPMQGYELAGFVWFQGYNDLIDGGTYPPVKGAEQDAYKLYGELLARFIRDVRKDLNAPKMPFVIGVMGLEGVSKVSVKQMAFRKAMAAPAGLPEFKGNVVAVQTAEYWDDKLAELDFRSMVAEEKHQRFDREGKYADLRARLAPLWKEYREAVKGKRDEIRQKIDGIIFTPEEMEYLRMNKSNAAFHYLGSAKIYSRIGKAFAEALVKMIKNGE